MPIINKGTSFSNGEQLTADKINNLLDLATFNQSATDSASTTVNSASQIVVADGGVTFAKLTDVIDDDTMATASATKLATSQSIKNYVDNNNITIKRKRVFSTTNLITSTIIPLDDTAPEIGEGGEVLSTTFTPASTDNKILVEFNGLAGSAMATQGMIMAVFEGSVCKGAQWWSQPSSGLNVCHITFEFTPGNTSAANYSLRFGPGSAGTAYVNRQSNAAHTLGGLQGYSMTISEVKA